MAASLNRLQQLPIHSLQSIQFYPKFARQETGYDIGWNEVAHQKSLDIKMDLRNQFLLGLFCNFKTYLLLVWIHFGVLESIVSLSVKKLRLHHHITTYTLVSRLRFYRYAIYTYIQWLFGQAQTENRQQLFIIFSFRSQVIATPYEIHKVAAHPLIINLVLISDWQSSYSGSLGWDRPCLLLAR